MKTLPQQKTWVVELHDEFVAEFQALAEDVQDNLLAVASAVQIMGPMVGRPSVDTLKGSKHANMKEMRFSASRGNQIWRAAFAFDPVSHAVILCAADKQGVSQQAFYKKLTRLADARFDAHLRSLKQSSVAAEKPDRQAKSAKGRKK